MFVSTFGAVLMQCRASNFDECFADFQKNLQDAEFVAIDTELTGVDIDGEPDSYEDVPAARLSKLCRIAERYGIIQIGLTLVGSLAKTVSDSKSSAPGKAGRKECLCASYNFFVFPYVDKKLGHNPCFMCSADALQFNAKHNVDFNTWLKEGLPHVCREDARRLEQADAELPKKLGLLRLWKMLCERQLPLVVHGPHDIFFLLRAFEQRVLPHDDPSKLAKLALSCFPRIYDTAHLHSVMRSFRRLKLTAFYDDVRFAHENQSRLDSISFKLAGETQKNYGSPGHERAHEAGYDSLVTAKLFVYLQDLYPEIVLESLNRLSLHKMMECLDLMQAAQGLEVGYRLYAPPNWLLQNSRIMTG